MGTTPDRCSLHAGLRLLGVRPADAVAFEDSEAGVAAAKAAGLTVVAIPQPPGLALNAADVVVDSLADLVTQ